MSLNANKNTLILAGGAVLLLFYVSYKAKETVKEVAEAVNPFNNNNVVADSVGAYDIGKWTYCKLNSDSSVCGYKY